MLERMQTKWLQIYEELGAVWKHGGDPTKPHARMRGGMCTDRFFNSDRLLENSFLLDLAMRDLLTLLVAVHGMNIKLPERVVGPAMGAVTLADGLARIISQTRHDKPLEACKTSYAAKVPRSFGGFEYVFERNFPLPGESILPVEDAITTGGSVSATVSACRELNTRIMPFVACLVNRSGLTSIGELEIVSLITVTSSAWKPGKCRLCAAGSEAIDSPKKKENWERLVESGAG